MRSAAPTVSNFGWTFKDASFVATSRSPGILALRRAPRCSQHVLMKNSAPMVQQQDCYEFAAELDSMRCGSSS
ncbi:MAG: hypothetical protein QF516_08055, partial [Pirellulaceae bacterium]|nr:hypothetical protein [Pirellulaceae bacterium]